MGNEKEWTESQIKELQLKARERTVRTQSIEYDLETIIHRIDDGKIKIDPAYQRRRRWSDETSSRLIESLLLNIPIPTVYISQDVDLDEENDEGVPAFSVIDGQQRLTAIMSFMKGKLTLVGLDVLSDLNGCTLNDLPSFLHRRLTDRTISCLRIDSTVDRQVKYDIFERLNTGSVKLEPQELRNATYRGLFNDMLIELGSTEPFLTLANLTDIRIAKMEDAELVLRFFALTDGGYANYKPNMKDYLDERMSQFVDLPQESLAPMRRRFLEIMEFIQSGLGNEPFSKYDIDDGTRMSKFNVAVYDAVVVAADELAPQGEWPADAALALRELFNDRDFFDAIQGSINDAKKLQYRIEAAKNVFGC